MNYAKRRTQTLPTLFSKIPESMRIIHIKRADEIAFYIKDIKFSNLDPPEIVTNDSQNINVTETK